MPHHHIHIDQGDGKRSKQPETPDERTRNPETHKDGYRHRERPWTREHFMGDLHRVSRRLTAEIESDPKEAAALDRARRHAREGKLISQDEVDRELGADDE